MPRYLSIQYLRGVAALGVLSFHAMSFVAGYGSGAVPTGAFRIGEAGVDIFFVISGVVLTLATRSPRSPRDFALGRLARVGIPYWIVTTGLAAAAIALPSLFRQAGWSAADVALSLAFVPSLAREGSLMPILQPAWSLSLEIIFYALLAATLGVAQARRSVLIAAMLCGLVAIGIATDPPLGLLRFYTQPLLVEFCLGIAVAHLVMAGFGLPRETAWLVVLLGFAGLGAAAFHPPEAFGGLRVLVYGLPAVLIVAGGLAAEKDASLPAIAAGTFGGAISYSLFLTHVVPAAIVAKLAGPRLGGLGALGDAILLVLILVAAVAIATIFHALVERPATRWSERLQAGSRRQRLSAA